MTEFNQIEQKVAEYEMARQELGEIDYDEKIEQIKMSLMAEVLLDFLRVEDKLIDQSGSKRAIIRSELSKLFYEKVDPEHSVGYETIAQGLSRSQKVCDFYWGTKEPRIVDQLSTEVLTGANAIKKSMEGNKFKEAFHRMYFIPPLIVLMHLIWS